MIKWFILCSESRYIKVKIWMVVNTTVMYWIKAKENGGDVTTKPFRNSVSIHIVSMMDYHAKIYTRRERIG